MATSFWLKRKQICLMGFDKQKSWTKADLQNQKKEKKEKRKKKSGDKIEFKTKNNLRQKKEKKRI